MQPGAEYPYHSSEYRKNRRRYRRTNRRRDRRSAVLCRRILLLALLLILCGCGGVASTEAGAAQTGAGEAVRPDRVLPSAAEAEPVREEGTEAPAGASGITTPPFFASSFHADKAVGGNGVLIDLSAASDGYIGVSGKSSGRMKFQVIKDGETYTYDMKSDGTPSIFPLQMEDGMYSFRALENVSGSKYAVVYTVDEIITIPDIYKPYLCASDYVNYTEDSACVKKAKEFASSAKDTKSFIASVYEFICSTVTYDKEKARTVQSGYLPVPDETMKTGKGICFDYASLAAAMLRSQGVPCKLIFGYVSPNEVYHAWNMFYTEESGWVTAKFEVSAKRWNRMDLTFSANGADGNFIGDGSNYKDVYCY